MSIKRGQRTGEMTHEEERECHRYMVQGEVSTNTHLNSFAR